MALNAEDALERAKKLGYVAPMVFLADRQQRQHQMAMMTKNADRISPSTP